MQVFEVRYSRYSRDRGSTHVHDLDMVLEGHSIHMVSAERFLHALVRIDQSQQGDNCCDILWHSLRCSRIRALPQTYAHLGISLCLTCSI